jgi:nitroimidazol reductase NimA-like FMN-containing flavoprotein (pyridoxamine 5'-phosphate oxidase superfamily)
VRELTPEACRQVVADTRVAYVSHIADDEPYVTPMSYVVHEGEFVFRTVRGRRLAALEADPRVCVAVSRETEGGGWESVVFWGTARFVDDPSTEAAVISELLAKYHTESALGFSSPSVFPEERIVVAVTPERMSGRASGSGLSTETRPGRL